MKSFLFTAALLVAVLLQPAAKAQAAHDGDFGFEPVPAGYIDQGAACKVDNLPPLIQQGALGLCYAATSSLVLTAENCRALNEDCGRVGPDQVFSLLGLASYSDWKNPGIQLGGNPANVLQMIAYKVGEVPSERCLSLDEITRKMGGTGAPSAAIAAQHRFWEWLRSAYERAHAGITQCRDCFVAAYPHSELQRKLEAHLTLPVSTDGLMAALAAPDFPRFLRQLLVPPDCRRPAGQVQLREAGRLTVHMYPEPQSGRTGDYDTTIRHIRQALLDRRPLVLGNICLDERVSTYANCGNLHGVVIAGLKRVCDPSGRRCADAVRVLNSWGREWQQAHSDGWVFARPLLDRTFYSEATLTWFGDRAGESLQSRPAHQGMTLAR